MKYSLLLILGLLMSCSSQVLSTQEHIKSYIGSSIYDAQRLYLTPHSQVSGAFEFKVYSLIESQKKFVDGDVQYTFSNPYLDCSIIYIANPEGIITSGSYLGEDCLF